MYLSKSEIKQLLTAENAKEKLIIRPLLSEKLQFGEMSLDLRLGTDFLISLFGREVSIDATKNDTARPVQSFFMETRRLVGETFVFHPNQTVLCSTLEYIKLPENIFLSLSTRSSYSRLGFTVSTIVQPGYCGCISIELTNTSNIPVKLLVGARMLQARFFKMESSSNYYSYDRKYVCQVRPQASLANNDKELIYLKELAKL